MVKWLKYMWSALKRFYWNVLNGVKNFWIFRKIVWHNRNWDYGYLIDFIIFKLTLLERELREDTLHVGAKQRANEVKQCRQALERWYADDYYPKRWEKLRAYAGETYFEPCNDGSGCSIMEHRNLNTKFKKEVHRKRFIKLMVDCEDRRQQDWDKFVRILTEKMRGWWT